MGVAHVEVITEESFARYVHRVIRISQPDVFLAIAMNSVHCTIIVMKAQHSVCAKPISLDLRAIVALMDTSVILSVNIVTVIQSVQRTVFVTK